LTDVRSGLAIVTTLAIAASVTPTAIAATDRYSGPKACVYSDIGSPAVKAAGYRGTNVTSYQLAGPGTIHYTVTKAAAQTFGVSASVGFDVGAFIAKAEAQFGVNYAYTATSTEAWGYDATVPSGQTGLMAVLHRDDRVSYAETTHHGDCTTSSKTGYSYIPLSTTVNTSYCVIRDLSPYAYSAWRSACAGE
jgi:hypothetical protein